MSVETEAMIEALWAEETEPLAQLVIIEVDGLDEPIRVSDCPDRLLPGRRQGIVSGGVEYPFFPFRLTWAGASQDKPSGEAKLSIANVDARIEAGIKAADAPPTATIRLVRVSAPDVVETAIEGAQIASADIDPDEVSASLRPKDFDLEPACARSYTPQTVPGLF